MKDKSLVTIILLDLLGKPIENAKYQVKSSNKLIAQGLTNSKGAIVDISRDKGIFLEIYFLNMIGKMQLIKTIHLEKKYALVRLYSPKILIKTVLRQNNDRLGNYKRKTYIVKKGDTLNLIAKTYKVSLDNLIKINNLKDKNKIYEKQVIKLPLIKEINYSGEENTIKKPDSIKPEKKLNPPPSLNTEPEDGSLFAITENILLKGIDYYEHFKEQLLNSHNTPLENKDENSQETGTPKQDITGFKPAIIFPFAEKPLNDIDEVLKDYYWAADLNSSNASMAVFGRNRASGGRLHAGIDLYANFNEVSKAQPGFNVLAIAPGVVLDSGGFYCETNQVTISHVTSDNREFIIRYGELDPKSIKVKKGDSIKQGEIIGKTGVLRSPKNNMPQVIIQGKNISMLHFEFFTGKNASLNSVTENFALTHKKNLPYMRRNDLANPKAILAEGYRNSFNFKAPNVSANDGDRIPIIQLTCSKQGQEFIKAWEGNYISSDGKKSYYYNDSAGYCTVGWGHLIGKNSCHSLGYKEMIDSIPISNAIKYFAEDVKKHEVQVKKAIKVPLHQYEFDALMSLSFNIGDLSIKAPKLCKFINSKDYENGPKEMLDINKANGVPHKGLTKRRSQEYNMFTIKNYDSTH